VSRGGAVDERTKAEVEAEAKAEAEAEATRGDATTSWCK
jgi:hypothetical protein